MNQINVFAFAIIMVNAVGGALALYMGITETNIALVAWGVMQAAVGGLVWFLNDAWEDKLKEERQEAIDSMFGEYEKLHDEYERALSSYLEE